MKLKRDNLVIEQCKNSKADAILLTEPRWIRDVDYGGDGALCAITCVSSDSTFRVGLQLDIVEKETISQVRLAIGGGEADPRA